MNIAICHRRKCGQVWGSPAPLPEVAGNLRCRKAPLWTFDYHVEKAESFCDVTPGLYRLVTWFTFLSVLYGENSLKSENWTNLTPRSSATVRCREKLTQPRKFPDNWTTMWSEQYLSAVHPNLLEIGRCEVPKRSSGLPHTKLALRSTRPSPHFAKNGPIASKILWTLSPLDVSTYTKFGPDRLRFAWLIPERLIFRPKKSLQLQLQPTMLNHSFIWVFAMCDVISTNMNTRRLCVNCRHTLIESQTSSAR